MTTVNELLEQAQGASADEVRALLQAEQASDHPRSTAVSGLEAILESLEASDEGEVEQPANEPAVSPSGAPVPGTVDADELKRNPTSLEQVEGRAGVQTDHDSHGPPVVDNTHTSHHADFEIQSRAAALKRRGVTA